MNRRYDDPPQVIRISSERLIDAKKKLGSCECTGRYCDHHRGRCGERLGEGWKIRLHPPGKEFGQPREMNSEAFEALLQETDALCAACARGHPNLLQEDR